MGDPRIAIGAPITDRGPRTSGNESGHRIRYHRHPLVHGDEEPGTGYQREQRLGHDRPPHSAPAPGRFVGLELGNFVARAGSLPFKVAGTLPQADDVAGLGPRFLRLLD